MVGGHTINYSHFGDPNGYCPGQPQDHLETRHSHIEPQKPFGALAGNLLSGRNTWKVLTPKAETLLDLSQKLSSGNPDFWKTSLSRKFLILQTANSHLTLRLHS